jgi:acetyl esterase
VVVIAGHDPLRDEGMAYADALKAAGVITVPLIFNGGVHGFMTMPTLTIAQEARREVCKELARLVSSQGESSNEASLTT